MNIARQFFLIPKPTITEQNCPDQLGKVHLVTGGYTGCGLALCKILYQHNATVYIAGRNPEKAQRAVDELKTMFPNSRGSVESLIVDLADLTSIKPAAEKFTAAQKSLHVLTLNAGVMLPPKGSKSAQGVEIQLATNCLGSYLLYKLLHPVLVTTAKDAPPGSVRVTWAGSIVIDLMSPRPGGMAFVAGTNEPKTLGGQAQYAQSKVGNLLLCVAMAQQDAAAGILHLCWNPGNLKTELGRHISAFERTFLNTILYAPVYGAYTELWAGVADIPLEKSGSFVAPWGRLGSVRSDIQMSCKMKSEGGNGVQEKFIAWCESSTAAHA